MTYKIITKNYLNPKNKTELTISEDEVGKYTYLTRELPGNRLDESDESLIQAVLDMLAVEYNPSNKIAEMDEAVAKMEAQVNELITNVRNEFDEIKKENAITQGATIELMNQVLPIVMGDNADAPTENPTDTTNTNSKGGETSDGDVTSN